MVYHIFFGYITLHVYYVLYRVLRDTWKKIVQVKY